MKLRLLRFKDVVRRIPFSSIPFRRWNKFQSVSLNSIGSYRRLWQFMEIRPQNIRIQISNIQRARDFTFKLIIWWFNTRIQVGFSVSDPEYNGNASDRNH